MKLTYRNCRRALPVVAMLAFARLTSGPVSTAAAASVGPTERPYVGALASAGGTEIPGIGLHPELSRVTPLAQPAGQVLLNCQGVSGNAFGVHCYGPDQIRAAYQIQPLLNRGVTGKGRTIVIVGAYAPPNVASDLQTFDGLWGLPNPALQVIAPQGAPAYDPTDVQQFPWGAESDIDVQWAHVIAPGAKIVLVEAKSALDGDVLAALRYAVDHNVGDVISMSFGEAESCIAPATEAAEHAIFARAAAKGVTPVAGAGDTGAAEPSCDGTSLVKAASAPASDPNVLAVGGTSLTADLSTGAYGSEAIWNNSDGAGGGGYSTIYSKPDYQRGVVNGRQRGLPDVAYNAASDYGIVTYISNWGPGAASFYALGGTSTGTPQWAGLAALAGQLAGHRLGAINDSLYDLERSHHGPAAFHDVTVGNNSITGAALDGSTVSVTGYTAGPGWDAASGLGSPVATALVPYLAQASRRY